MMCAFAYMSSVIMNSIIWFCSVFGGTSCKFLLRIVNETTNTVSHNLQEGTTLGTTATDELITLLKLAMPELLQSKQRVMDAKWGNTDWLPSIQRKGRILPADPGRILLPQQEREQKHKIRTLTSLSYVKGSTTTAQDTLHNYNLHNKIKYKLQQDNHTIRFRGLKTYRWNNDITIGIYHNSTDTDRTLHNKLNHPEEYNTAAYVLNIVT